MTINVPSLLQRYRAIYRESMQGLPIVNDRLQVEAVAFQPCGEHEIGVLITPWFMNLVLLPGGADWDENSQGTVVEVGLPAAAQEFMVSRDEELGVFLTAILFRTVADFPDQATARDIAQEVMKQLFEPGQAANQAAADCNARVVSRRELFARFGSG